MQLHLLVQAAFAQWSGVTSQYGFGDTEIGAKYRFLPADEKDWWPQLGFYPLLGFPTGNPNRGLGTGATHALFPIWLQKDLGNWTTFGGGGYWINPGPGNQNFWFFGLVLQYQLTKLLSLGGELFHETPFATVGPGAPAYPLGTKDATGFNIGGTYDLNETHHILFAFGRGLQNVSATNIFTNYLALPVTY